MLAIDTLKLAEDLKKGGFNDKQTESLVNLGRELSQKALEQIATKDDLKVLEKATKDDLKALEKATKADIEGLRKDTKADIEGLRKDTKADIEGLRKDTKADIEGLRKDLIIDMANLRTDMYKAMTVQTLALLGLGFTLFKLFG